MNATALFLPFAVRSLQLKNRILMAPMTRSQSPHGIPSSEVAAYYRRRAEAEVGLIVTEGTAIDRAAAKNDPNVPHFFGDALPAWKQVVDGVHAAGGLIAPQLWHVGGRASSRSTWAPAEPYESPSGIDSLGAPFGVAMSADAIRATIDAYGRAAAAARELGFDAVELHGAHGYLIDQFFWDVTNRRTDEWGGPTLAARTRFAVEVVKAVRAAIGPALPLILRLSQWKIGHYDIAMARTPDEMRSWLEPLAEAGVDVFHCSQRTFSEPAFAGSDLNFAGWAKALTGKPTITVGSVGLTGEFMGTQRRESSEPAPIDELLHRLEREEFDLVAVGRPLLADPQWVTKIRTGRLADLKIFNEADRLVLY